MLRVFTRYATRWMIIGFISILATGGVPAIAAACEGGGEEQDIELVKEGEEKGALILEAENPFDVEAEIVAFTKTGAGEILVNECLKGNRYKKGEACLIVQHDPAGAIVDFKRL